jgi:mono/diheme cytochrome c family protein
MANTLKVTVFIFLVVAAIAGFASMIPQLESPAPAALEISGEMTGAELAAVGQEVFDSPEAGCTACHALGREGLRGPDLGDIGATAANRVPGESAEEYLRKAVVEPCAHVTEGYDCIMPPTLLQTLGEAKVTALVAYMQSLGGEVTVVYSGETQTDGESSPGAETSPGGVPGTTAEEILQGAGCGGCHTIGEVGVPQGIGPDLSAVGASLSVEEIRQAILDPDAVVAEACPGGNPCPPGLMPKDYGQKLSAGQLETIVAYLSELK